jgi:hypothetical protein
MAARVLPFLVVAALVGLPVLGALPSVLQPNVTAYSSAELTPLLAGLSALKPILNDDRLGSDRFFASSQWDSRHFAAYTAGTLGSLGYETRLVAQAGWPDETHTWVLVGIPLGGRTAWVPVEASPQPGHAQETLGTVPSRSDSTGQLWFENRYATFAQEVVLPRNIPPVAQIRSIPASAGVRETVTFMGTACVDPDGEIVRYVWTLGDAGSFAARNVQHAFSSAGTYAISLTVTDSRGASATTTFSFVVGKSTGTPATPPSSCHCGG